MSFGLLEKYSSDVDILNLKGIVHGKSGDYDKAIDCFEKVLALDKNHTPAQENKKIAENLKNRPNLVNFYNSLQLAKKELIIKEPMSLSTLDGK